VGVLLAIALLERCGRKNTQVSTYLLSAIGAALLSLFFALHLPARPSLLIAAVICRIGAMAGEQEGREEGGKEGRREDTIFDVDYISS